MKVRDQHEVCMCSVRGRHRTAHPTEVAKARGQNRVEQYRGVTVPPGAGAVPPPCQRGRHRTGRVELRGPYGIEMLGWTTGRMLPEIGRQDLVGSGAGGIPTVQHRFAE